MGLPFIFVLKRMGIGEKHDKTNQLSSGRNNIRTTRSPTSTIRLARDSRCHSPFDSGRVEAVQRRKEGKNMSKEKERKIALIREKLSIIESEIQVCKRILRGEQE